MENINDTLDFLLDEEIEEEVFLETYKIIIADDDEEIHRVTKVILKYFNFEGRGIDFIDTFSGEETKIALAENPDTAIIFLDVVMEESDSGLKVAKYLREELKNSLTRIVLRTGQPGEAPEEEVIRIYDINDYRLKTELTVKRLHTTLYSSLRNYRDLQTLEKNKKGLEKIIRASAKLFEHNTLDDFLVTILNELSQFNYDPIEMLYIREENAILSDGMVILEQSAQNKVIAATGKYEHFINQEIESIGELNYINKWINNRESSDDLIHTLDNGFIIESRGKSHSNNYIYIDGNKEDLDLQLINLFLSNFSIALDNYILNNMLQSTQKEIVFALAETVECHFEETGSHIKRISEMMYQFALCNRYSYGECELLKLASTMHDLGKIAIPDNILKKPGSLTVEEFEIMKTHTNHGYRILRKPGLPIIKMAAEIALNHHEKFDGSGYPAGKKGLDIPLNARMMAIVDVFDAMTHKRVYKDAVPMQETIAYINNGKGKHFDAELVDVFMSNLDKILSGVKDM
jgi:response regulator RpfG family c-di-GMP phosphodiesterase